MKKTICIVTPCYNEEASIQDCYDTVQEIARRDLPDYQIQHLFCDNASSDSTVDILREMQLKTKRESS